MPDNFTTRKNLPHVAMQPQQPLVQPPHPAQVPTPAPVQPAAPESAAVAVEVTPSPVPASWVLRLLELAQQHGEAGLKLLAKEIGSQLSQEWAIELAAKLAALPLLPTEVAQTDVELGPASSNTAAVSNSELVDPETPHPLPSQRVATPRFRAGKEKNDKN